MTASPRRVLIVLHQEQSTPGRVGRLLQHMGMQLDIRRPRYGDPLPKTMSGHAAAVIFGGPMSANDTDDFIKQEIDWIGVPLRDEKPVLGLCLGAQMLARHLGERVYTHPQGRVEVGYYRIHSTPAGRALCSSPFPDHVYQWHKEGFDLPKGAELLASGGDFEIQACRYGSAYGLQFHPEVTYAMMCRWTTRAHERMGAPGAQPRDAHLQGWYVHDGVVSRWIETFLREKIVGAVGARPTVPRAAASPRGRLHHISA